MQTFISFAPAAWIMLSAVCTGLVIRGLALVFKRAGLPGSVRRPLVFRAAALGIGWPLLLLGLALTGFFADFSKLPPRPVLAVLFPLPFFLLAVFSRRSVALLRAMPLHWPVYLQAFRIVVELLLFLACRAGLLPVQMSFEGMNFDVLTGLLAIYAGYRLQRDGYRARWVGVVFNGCGLLLLLNILVIALLSMPTPFRVFQDGPANTLVGEFPFILLPGVCVPLAYGLHIVSLRQLMGKSFRSGDEHGLTRR